MGGAESKEPFQQGLRRLAGGEAPAAEEKDEFWRALWACPVTSEDIFASLDVPAMRAWRSEHPDTLVLLLQAAADKLQAPSSAPDERQRCVVVLLRLLPFCYESEPDVPLADTFASRLIEGGESSLISRVVHALVRSLFVPGYTVTDKVAAISDDAQEGINLATHAWAAGVGVDAVCGTQPGAWAPCGSVPAATVHQRRSAVLRALGAACCSDVFCRSSQLLVDGSRSDVLGAGLRALAGSSSSSAAYAKIVLASLLNTVCSYDPAARGASAAADSAVQAALQLLCVLLTWKHCTGSSSSSSDAAWRSSENAFIELVRQLDSEPQLRFVAAGLARIIAGVVANDQAFSLFGTATLAYYREALVVLWALLAASSRFAGAVVASDAFPSLLAHLLFFIHQGRQHGTMAGVVHVCGLVLLRLSECAEFGAALSSKCAPRLPFSLPGVVPGTTTQADMLVALVSTLFGAGAPAEYDALLEMFLVVLGNAAPTVCGIGVAAATKYLALVEHLARTRFLLQSPRCPFLLSVAVSAVAVVLRRNAAANANFVYAVLEHDKLFRRLAALTPQSFLEAAAARHATAEAEAGGDAAARRSELPAFATERWCEGWVGSLAAQHVVDVIDYLMAKTQEVCKGVAEDQDAVMQLLQRIELPDEQFKAMTYQLRKYEHNVQSAQWVIVMVWSVVVLEQPAPLNHYKALRVSLFAPAVTTSAQHHDAHKEQQQQQQQQRPDEKEGKEDGESKAAQGEQEKAEAQEPEKEEPKQEEPQHIEEKEPEAVEPEHRAAEELEKPEQDDKKEAAEEETASVEESKAVDEPKPEVDEKQQEQEHEQEQEQEAKKEPEAEQATVEDAKEQEEAAKKLEEAAQAAAAAPAAEPLTSVQSTTAAAPAARKAKRGRRRHK